MVERYRQPGLPSPVVGTPGVNKAAGAAAAEASKVAEQMTNEQFAAARNIGESVGKVEQGIHQGAQDVLLGMYFGAHQKAAIQNDLDSNAKVLAEPRQQAEVDAAVAGVKAAHPDNPEVWGKTFDQDHKQQLLETESEQYADNPNRQRLMLGQKLPMVTRASNLLKVEAPKAEKDKQSAQIEHLVPVAQNNVSVYPSVAEGAGLHDILANGRQEVTHIAKVYDHVANQAEQAAINYPDKAPEFKLYAADVRSRIPAAQTQVAKTWWDKQVGSRLSGDIHYVEALQKLLPHAGAVGLGLKGDDLSTIASHLDQAKQAAEGIAINKVQDQTQEDVFNITTARNQVDQAAQSGDLDALADRQKDLQDQRNSLVAEKDQLSKLPPNKVTLAKLQGLNQREKAISGGIRVDINKEKQVKLANDREARKKAATALGNARKTFQDQIENFRDQITAAHAIPIGPEQKAAVDAITGKAYDAFHDAQAAGTIKDTKPYRTEFQAFKVEAGAYQQDPKTPMQNVGDAVGKMLGQQPSQPTYSRVTSVAGRIANKSQQATLTGQSQQMRDLDNSYGKILRQKINDAKGDETVKSNAWNDLSPKYKDWIGKYRSAINPATKKAYTEDAIKAKFDALAQTALNYAQAQEDAEDRKFDSTSQHKVHTTKTGSDKFTLVPPPPPYMPSLLPELNPKRVTQGAAVKLEKEVDIDKYKDEVETELNALPLKGGVAGG